MISAPTVGFYGKLPCNGDFIYRRVPREFVDVWDRWVCESLLASRRRLQERWREAYLSSPAWRFVLAGGLCGAGMYAGIMLPSVDRVGRCFPLAIVAHWSVEDSELQTACNQKRWFESAMALGLATLSSTSINFDEFDRRVAELATDIVTGTGRTPLPGAMALDELVSRPQPLSFWCSGAADEPKSDLLCVSGLPDPHSFAVMWPNPVAARIPS
jgi:type VI secretion system protein ImpM